MFWLHAAGTSYINVVLSDLFFPLEIWRFWPNFFFPPKNKKTLCTIRNVPFFSWPSWIKLTKKYIWITNYKLLILKIDKLNLNFFNKLKTPPLSSTIIHDQNLQPNCNCSAWLHSPTPLITSRIFQLLLLLLHPKPSLLLAASLLPLLSLSLSLLVWSVHVLPW